MKSNFVVPIMFTQLQKRTLSVNNMLLRHLSDLAYWLHLKLFHRTLYEQFVLQKLTSSMLVALDLPASTHSLYTSGSPAETSLSTQDPQKLFEQITNGKQSNFRLTLTELVRLNQTIQIILNLYAFRNHLSQ